MRFWLCLPALIQLQQGTYLDTRMSIWTTSYASMQVLAEYASTLVLQVQSLCS